MKRTLFFIFFFYVVTLVGGTRFFCAPKWNYYEVKDVLIIYDEQFEYRAKLIASFLHFITDNRPETKFLLKNEYFVIDSNYISENLNFDFHKFVDDSFDKKKTSKLEYDPITLTNLQQLTQIPLTLDFSVLKKDLLQYLYNVSHGKTLRSAKSALYPDWFEEPIDYEASSSYFMLAFERKFQLAFYDNYRDFALNNHETTFNQLFNGSYKKKQPSPLYYGVLAQNYFMIEYGIEKWEKIVRDVEYFNKIFFPYSRAFKTHTGITLEEFYENTNSYYHKKFVSDLSTFPPDVSKPVLELEDKIKNRSFSNPHFLANGDLIAKFSSFDETSMVVHIDKSNNIVKLAEIGFSHSDKLSVNEPYVLWSQNFAYPDFYTFDFSRIAIFDLEDKTISYIGGNKDIYQKPALSPNQDLLSVVSFNKDVNQNIVVIDFATHKKILTIPNHECLVYKDLKWLNQNELIYISMNFLGQNAIHKYNIQTKTEERITPNSIDPIDDLNVFNNEIYFSYPVNDIFNVCVLSPEESLASQTFYAEVSASQATVNDSLIVFVSDRFWGDELRKVELDREFWSPIMWNDFKDLSGECGKIINYDKVLELNQGKLSPFYKLIDFKRPRLGYDQREALIYSVSQNPMRTFLLHAETKFDFSSLGIKTTLSNVISKVYPNIMTEISHSNAQYSNDKHEEITFGSSLKLPYYFGAGSYAGFLNANAGVYHLDRYKSRKVLNFLEDATQTLNYFRGDLALNISKKRAQNNFYSPFGQRYTINYRKTLAKVVAEQTYASADFSYKGFRKTDAVLLETSTLFEKSTNEYHYDNPMVNTYGYTGYPDCDRIYKSTLKYYMPLFYPEKGISNVLYFKRLYTALFANYTKVALDKHGDEITAKTREFNSIGSELILDYNIIDSIELSVGLRYSYALNGDNGHQIDIFIPFATF